jgi:hypothetical protein
LPGLSYQYETAPPAEAGSEPCAIIRPLSIHDKLSNMENQAIVFERFNRNFAQLRTLPEWKFFRRYP